MKKLLVIASLFIFAACEPGKSNLESKIDPETGYGLIDYGSEGSIILGPGFVIVKRDSTYYIPQNGNTYHTMAVRVYSVPNCRMDSAMKLLPNFIKQDTTTWNQK